MDNKDKQEVIEIVEETIKMYFDKKQKDEKPKDKGQSYFMIFAGGATALYIIYQMSTFFNNL